MKFVDTSLGERKRRILQVVAILASAWFPISSAQLQQQPPWQLQFQQPRNPADTSLAATPQSQQQQPPPSPTVGNSPTSPTFIDQPINVYQPQSQPLPLDPQNKRTGTPTTASPLQQQLPQQSNPFTNFQQPLYNFQSTQDQLFDPNLVSPNFVPFTPAVPLQSPPQLINNPLYAQAQNQLLYTDDLQQKLQLQLQIAQQIQQQIEQLQKLQELQRQNLRQQKKLIDEGKLDLDRGGSSSQGSQAIYSQIDQRNLPKLPAGIQSIYQQIDQSNPQKLASAGVQSAFQPIDPSSPTKFSNQEFLPQHSLLSESTISNLQFASPTVNALQKSSFVASPVFLENVTDPSLPYYLVAPSINSISLYDQLQISGLASQGLFQSGGAEARAILAQNLDITTSAPNLATATSASSFGDVTTASPGSEVYTPTDIAEKSGIGSGTQTPASTTLEPAQRRSHSGEVTLAPRTPRERQPYLRRLIGRGQKT